MTASSSFAQRTAAVWHRWSELLSSMRFAIALLTVICIASVIGTVLQQHEPVVNYVNKFGPFWAELFLTLKLNAVYSAWWFLLILAFLVLSTSLCIIRKTPKYLADIRSYKEDIRQQSLKAFGHKAEADLPQSPEAEAMRMGQLLAGGGWKVRLQARETPQGQGWMVAAKAGAFHKIGFIAAHSAIVMICLGGLLDGDLLVRGITWLGGKSVYSGGGLVSEVPAQHRLPTSNPAFRGNLLVSEGAQSSTAVLSQSDGVLLQELPFAVELKKFIVDYYPTGMPKLFASEVVIHDRETGEKLERRIEVNHPASYKGVQIYQSSFEDGGSRIQLRGIPLQPGLQPLTLNGQIGGSAQLMLAGQPRTIEFVDLRVINVENMTGTETGGIDVRRVDLVGTLGQRLGAADKTISRTELRNVGPSVVYKLRDAAGQATEHQNYMRPVRLSDEADPVFLLGVRSAPSEPFLYLRVPVDEEESMQGFLDLRAALLEPAWRARAVQRYVTKVVEADRPDLTAQLTESARRTLDLFTGGEQVNGRQVFGLQAVSDFIQASVPASEHERAAEVLMRLLNGTVYELNALVREQRGKPPQQDDEAAARYAAQAVVALSDAFFYPAPVVFELTDFTQVQASVFQVARTPGQNVVYLGCLLLILGIFAMLYIRERRLWIWLAPAGTGSHASMALSMNRKTLDVDREFAHLQDKLLSKTS